MDGVLDLIGEELKFVNVAFHICFHSFALCERTAIIGHLGTSDRPCVFFYGAIS